MEAKLKPENQVSDISKKHKNFVKNTFNKVADQYGSVGTEIFSYFGKKLVKYAGIVSGQTILDIACGKGASLFPARIKVGKYGKVIGIDLSPEMLKLIKLEINNRGFKNIEIYEMDAEELNFDSNTFDTIISGFSLFFLPNLKNALDEIHRVLKPGGVFVTSTFGERDTHWNPIHEMFTNIQKTLSSLPLTKTKILNTKEEIYTNFDHSNFENIEIYSEPKEFYYKNEQDWWNSIWSHGYRGILQRVDKKSLEKFKNDSLEVLKEMKVKQGIPEQTNVLITKAYNK